MLLLPMILHVKKAIAFEITDLALKFDDSRVDTLVCSDLNTHHYVGQAQSKDPPKSRL